jgi:hypothetical protein
MSLCRRCRGWYFAYWSRAAVDHRGWFAWKRPISLGSGSPLEKGRKGLVWTTWQQRTASS